MRNMVIQAVVIAGHSSRGHCRGHCRSFKPLDAMATVIQAVEKAWRRLSRATLTPWMMQPNLGPRRESQDPSSGFPQEAAREVHLGWMSLTRRGHLHLV
jgi:hypothetical protein